MNYYELDRADSIRTPKGDLYRLRATENVGNIYRGAYGGYITEDTILEDGAWVSFDSTVVSSQLIGNILIKNNSYVESSKIKGNNIEVDNSKIRCVVDGTVQIKDSILDKVRIKVREKTISLICDSKIENTNIDVDYVSIIESDILETIIRGSFVARIGDLKSKRNYITNCELLGFDRIGGGCRLTNVQLKNDVRVNNIILDNKKLVSGRFETHSFKKYITYQCQNRLLTAILTENDEVLFSLGCQINITKEEFINRIHTKNGGLKNNPHRQEYLNLIPMIEFFLKNLNN